MRFSIRDLLYLVVIVSLALAFWIERRNSASTSARYQIQVVEDRAFVVDTVTGQVREKSFSPQGGYTSPDIMERKAAP
jgi:hypothetical protein